MNDQNGNQEQYRQWAPYVLIAALLLLAYLTFQYNAPLEPSYEIAYSQFKDLANKGRVESLQLQGDVASGTLKSTEALGPHGEIAQRFSTRLPAFGDESLLPLIESQAIELKVSGETGKSGPLAILLSLLPWLFLLLFFFWVFQRTSRALGGRLGGPEELKKFLEA
ncbi:MAG: ATP-dependent metallopeptidase FtsH/Yme1/Tma family protein, partial [Gammaproteobacteria bacterium]